eukprot:3475401-Amphidinium_carterae.2
MAARKHSNALGAASRNLTTDTTATRTHMVWPRDARLQRLPPPTQDPAFKVTSNPCFHTSQAEYLGGEAVSSCPCALLVGLLLLRSQGHDKCQHDSTTLLQVVH